MISDAPTLSKHGVITSDEPILLFTKRVTVYARYVGQYNKTQQMALSLDNSIRPVIIDGQQPNVTSTRQPSMKLIHPNVA